MYYRHFSTILQRFREKQHLKAEVIKKTKKSNSSNSIFAIKRCGLKSKWTGNYKFQWFKRHPKLVNSIKDSISLSLMLTFYDHLLPLHLITSLCHEGRIIGDSGENSPIRAIRNVLKTSLSSSQKGIVIKYLAQLKFILSQAWKLKQSVRKFPTIGKWKICCVWGNGQDF